ncbi:PorV/PorQ family protein [Candidatus Poribacteria bacterium]|nr:PorV/PorQ family protein [Candidatus Poribacteria bacterium]
MKNLMVRNIILFLIISIIPATAKAAFTDVELGARPLSMGASFVAVADDNNAIFWNPAGLESARKKEFTASYMELYDMVSYSALSYIRKFREIPVGLGLVSSSDVEGVYREIGLYFSLARNIRDKLDIGTSLKYLSSTAYTANMKLGNSRGLSLDAGIQYHNWRNILSFGLNFHNILGQVSYNRKSVKEIPGESYWQRPDFSYRIGLAVNPFKMPSYAKYTLVSAEICDGDFHLGLERSFWNILSLRAGLRTGNALNCALTAGFGLRMNALRFDYAYVGSKYGTETSQFSVSIRL